MIPWSLRNKPIKSMEPTATTAECIRQNQNIQLCFLGTLTIEKYSFLVMTRLSQIDEMTLMPEQSQNFPILTNHIPLMEAYLWKFDNKIFLWRLWGMNPHYTTATSTPSHNERISNCIRLWPLVRSSSRPVSSNAWLDQPGLGPCFTNGLR